MATGFQVVNCRRFLRAWARFRDAQAPQQDAESLFQVATSSSPAVVDAQYRLMAQHFQQLIAGSEAGDRLKAMEAELAPVIKEIERLASEQDDEVTRLRVPSFARRHPRKAGSPRLSPRSPSSPGGEPTVAKKEDQPLREDVPEASARSEWELDAREFDTMLDDPPVTEEKLTTRALRKRLGLVDCRAGEQPTASEAVAQAEQEALQSEMAALAKQLKERTQTINQSLVDDVKILEAVGESAEANTTLLDRENEVLKQQLASSIGLWTTLWLIAMVAAVFVVMYLFMKVFGRRW